MAWEFQLEMKSTQILIVSKYNRVRSYVYLLFHPPVDFFSPMETKTKRVCAAIRVPEPPSFFCVLTLIFFFSSQHRKNHKNCSYLHAFSRFLQYQIRVHTCIHVRAIDKITVYIVSLTSSHFCQYIYSLGSIYWAIMMIQCTILFCLFRYGSFSSIVTDCAAIAIQRSAYKIFSPF